MSKFSSLAVDLEESLGALDMPRRVSVSQGAAEALMLSDAGGYTGPWSPDMVPYLIKPMDLLASRVHEAVCFAGPARTGKTAGLILGWMAHTLTNDIGRMMVLHMTEHKAEELSKLDVDPAIDASPKLRALRSPYGHDNNIKLKIFKHGMAIKFAYPTPSHLSGGTYRYLALTDYDRFPSPRGAGEIFDNAHKRTETAMSRRMTLVESSPEREITDPDWKPATPHEAPPCGGVLGIYNRGDRQMWYWPCPHCREHFKAAPGLKLFASLPDEDDLLETIRGANINALAEEHAVIFCPNCGAGIEQKHKFKMNASASWVLDGCHIDKDGKIHGPEIPPSPIASFWLGGVSAAYQKWDSILRGYLQGLKQYAIEGNEETVRKSFFTDQAMPYLPRVLRGDARARDPSDLAEDFPRYIVPEQARFVVASADVQGGQNARFVVQVHAIGPNLEQWLIDRYEIKDSNRPGNPPLDPASYPEDWGTLNDKVLASTYRTTVEGQELRVKLLVVDSGGEEGVTENAYQWFQKAQKAGLSHKVRLYKGGSTAGAPLLRQTRVGPRKAVPQLLCNPNLLKDAVHNASRREDAGASRLHFPDWLGATFWDEMKAEVRQANGTWKKIRKRNEALDLCAMIRAGCLHLGADRINWANPPAWAKPVAENSERESRDERRQRQQQKPPPKPKSKIAKSSWSSRL